MHTLPFVAAAAAIVSASVPAPGNAQTIIGFLHDPVRLVRFSAAPSAATTIFAWGGNAETIGVPASATISFINDAHVSATSIEFAVRANGRTETIEDAGTFSTGATITHPLALSGSFENVSSIEVERVRFADGSVWTRG